MNAPEQLISEIAGYISELVPINVMNTKNQLSKILSTYHVQKVESDEVHPDLTEKITLFFAGKMIDGMAESTAAGYERELNKFAEEVKKKVEEITTSDIRVYLSKSSHLAKPTINKKISVIKSFFGWLTGEEILQRDPSAKLKSIHIDQRPPKALTIEELEMLREFCKTPRQRAFVEVMYATGCRLSEVSGMDREHIDFHEKSALVIGKGDKQRTVYFSFKAMYHLKKYLKTRTDECKALFVTERKPYRRLSNRGIQDEIYKIADYAGLGDKVSPHVLRHTFATLTLNNGADITAVQELLGHEKPETTMIYARVTEERKREQHKKYLVQ